MRSYHSVLLSLVLVFVFPWISTPAFAYETCQRVLVCEDCTNFEDVREPVPVEERGSVLRRGEYLTELERNQTRFTVIVNDQDDWDRLMGLDGISSVKMVGRRNRTFRVRVASPAQKTEVMSHYRERWQADSVVEDDEDPLEFTANIPSEDALAELTAMEGVDEVRLDVRRRMHFKVDVEDPAQLDAAMEAYRVGGKGVAHHAYNVKPAPGLRPTDSPSGAYYYLSDQIVVRFTGEALPPGFEERFGLRAIKRLAVGPNTWLFQVNSSAGQNPIKLANELDAQDEVEWAEVDLINRAETPLKFQPNRHQFTEDQLLQFQWDKDSREMEGHPRVRAGAGMGVRDTWKLGTGRGVRIAVFDDGFDFEHPDFNFKDGRMKVVFQRDLADGDGFAFPGPQDYHGTPTAGTAAASRNGYGTVGAAPDAELILVRLSLAETDSELAEIFYEVAMNQGAHAINCSWGPSPVWAPIGRLLSDVFTYIQKHGAGGRGTGIFFAAGNSNAPIHDPDNRWFEWFDYSTGGRVVTRGPITNGFAAHPSVYAVGAVSSMRWKSAYSSHGIQLSLVAPSDDWDPLAPMNPDDLTLGIIAPDNERIGADMTPDSDVTFGFGGTSAASPNATGAYALVRSTVPNLHDDELRVLLQGTATKRFLPRPEADPGDPRAQFDPETGVAVWYGHGKVNPTKAAELAIELDDLIQSAFLDVYSFEPEELEESLAPRRKSRSLFRWGGDVFSSPERFLSRPPIERMQEIYDLVAAEVVNDLLAGAKRRNLRRKIFDFLEERESEFSGPLED